MAKKITFKNGLRLLLVPQEHSLASIVLILVEAGSEYETKRINGLSHFLEHLMFKGTKNRPHVGAISKELDSLGAQSNAFTGQEYTGYWAKAQYRNLDKILDVVSDLYLNPLFNSEEIEKERGVVIEEINMYEDMPMRRVHSLFAELVYGDQPAGWDIAGPKEVIRTVPRDKIMKYRAKHYVAPKTIVVVGGRFDEKKVIRAVTTLFGHLPRAPHVKKFSVRESQKIPAVLLKHKASDQSHLVLGVRAFDMFDTRRYALQLLADVLGGGMSSRLFHRIREVLGAAYYIRAETDLSLDHGTLAVSAGVDHTKIQQVMVAVLDEMRRLTREIVPKDELQKSKDHLTGNFLMSLETADELAGYYGGQEVLTRKLVSPSELVRRIQAVRAEAVQGVARALFTNSRLNLAVIGPYKNPAHFRKLLKF